MKNVIKELFLYAKVYLKQELLGMLFTILYTGAIFISPIVSKYLIDDVMPSKSMYKLTVGILIFFFGCIGQPIFGYIKNRIFMKISEKTTVSLRENMFNKMVDAPLTFFDENNMGAIVSRISNDGRSISDFITNFFVVFLKNIVLILIILAGMLLLSARMTLFIIILFSVYFVINFYMSKKFAPLSRKIQQSYDNICIKINHTVAQINTVKLYNQEQAFKKEFKDIIEESYYYNMKSRKLNMLISCLNNALVITSLALVYGYGSYMVIKGESTIGTIIAFGLYFQNLVQPIYEFLNNNIDIRNMEPIIQRINEYNNLESERSDNGEELEKIKSIQMKQVSFAYANGVKALDNINLEFSGNGMYAIVGDSGAGKSTLIKLMSALYDSYDGEIYVNGIELRHYGVNQIRSNISFVTQETELRNASIRDNIKLDKEIDDSKIEEIIKFVNLKEVVNKLENGIDTIMNERTNLSGGEKQRLAIARALAKESSIYIFDEPTAALDTVNEKIIKEIIEQLSKEKIVIIITHNLALLNEADLIYVMKQGKIMEQGVYSKLKQEGKYFMRLMDALVKEEKKQENEE